MLRDIATPETSLARINRVVQRIREEFARPLRMEELAEDAAMSVSAFHRHFKAATTLSPLQYQKHTRLLQARTLLISAGANVTSVAHEVGYESPTSSAGNMLGSLACRLRGTQSGCAGVASLPDAPAVVRSHASEEWA
jgi:AraC-like DNA-binding protein